MPTYRPNIVWILFTYLPILSKNSTNKVKLFYKQYINIAQILSEISSKCFKILSKILPTYCPSVVYIVNIYSR